MPSQWAERVASGHDLSMTEMTQLIGQIMDGTWQDEEIVELLEALNNNSPAETIRAIVDRMAFENLKSG